MGVVYTTFAPSSGVPPLVCWCGLFHLTCHVTLWAWPIWSHDRSHGISHSPIPVPPSDHCDIIVPETPYLLSCVYTLHWQIWGGAAGMHPPLPTGSISFIFTYIFAKKCTHRRSVPPQQVDTPTNGKSWIRHCLANNKSNHNQK